MPSSAKMTNSAKKIVQIQSRLVKCCAGEPSRNRLTKRPMNPPRDACATPLVLRSVSAVTGASVLASRYYASSKSLHSEIVMLPALRPAGTGASDLTSINPINAAVF
jgi:hypothetical protein